MGFHNHKVSVTASTQQFILMALKKLGKQKCKNIELQTVEEEVQLKIWSSLVKRKIFCEVLK